MVLYKPRTTTEALFALLVVVEATVVSAINGRLTFLFTKNGPGERGINNVGQGFTMALSLTLFGLPYMLMLTYDALAQQNLFQACGLCIYNLWMIVYFLLIIYAGFTYHVQDTDVDPRTIEPLVLSISNVSWVAICTVLQAILTWRLYKEWRWVIFRLLDAKQHLQSLYRNYQVLATLLKFDFLFFTGGLIQLIVVLRGRTNSEFAFTVTATACILPFLLVASRSTARENLYASLLCIVVLFAYLILFIFKMVRMFSPAFEKPYLFLRPVLIFWLAVTIAYAVATIVVVSLHVKNFGGGLKRYLAISKDVPLSTWRKSGISSQSQYHALTEEHRKPATSSSFEVHEMQLLRGG